MGYHSGKFGVVNNVPAMISWNISDDEDLKEYINSQTRGMAGQLPGISNWTGSIEQNGVNPVAGLMPGSLFAFQGYTAPDNDTAGGSGTILSGNIMVERMSMAWNWAGGDIEKTSYEFQGSGPLAVNSGQPAISDTSTPTYYGSKQLPQPTIQVNGTGGFINWPYITQLTITLSNEIQPVVNASTGGNTVRVAGPWKLEISASEQEVLRSLFQKENILEIKVPVDPTFINFWDIKFGVVKNFTNIEVNRETGAIISRSVQIIHSAYDFPLNNPANLGSITLPGAGSAWWPVVGS